MQNNTTKKRTGYLAAILAAVLLCLITFMGFAAKPAPTASADGEPTSGEGYRIGVSVPDESPYKEYMNSAISLFDFDYELLESNCYNDVAMQIEIIYNFIVLQVDALIIAPVANDGSLQIVLDQAYNEGIIIVVLGEPNPDYPDGITYIMQGDYYDLGFNHAEWIFQNPDINEESVIYVYYYLNENGDLYKQGVIDGLATFGIFANVECIPVTDLNKVYDQAEAVFKMREEKGLPDIDEIVTYSTAIAERILDCSYAVGYHDDTSGIGIRAFAYGGTDSGDGEANELDEEYKEEYENYKQLTAQIIAGTVAALLNGEINGGSIISLGFAPGYAKYVSK
ncbi:MAG: sugar ABC transporter substrate-binding protein [Clostridiales bacterium]|nr:sugar ABC transporter substrate-binding protein [Clostridiales bacterium]